MKWRTGRKLGRTLYLQLGNDPSDDDMFIGMMETSKLADQVIQLHNNKITELNGLLESCKRNHDAMLESHLRVYGALVQLEGQNRSARAWFRSKLAELRWGDSPEESPS